MIQTTITPAYADFAGERAKQEWVLNAARDAWGEVHAKTLLAKNNLGVTLHKLGCLPQARELLESALNNGPRVWGKKHPNTMATMHNLASLLDDVGDASQALVLLIRVMKWHRCTFGDEHPDTIDAMGNLAYVHSRLGNHEAAKELQAAVLKFRRQHFGKDHPETLEAMGDLGSTINNIAVDLRNEGYLADAEPLQLEALKLVMKAFGSDHLVTACVLSATGALLARRGAVEQAYACFSQALEIREKRLGADATLTQLVRNRLYGLRH